MSTFAYREPYRLSAGVMTLLTHVLFFALLYLGVNWHFEPPQGMQVELWASLPQPAAAPPIAVPPQPVTQEPARQKEAEAPAPPAKAEIALPQQKKKPAAKPKETPKPEPNKALSKAQQEKLNREMQAQTKEEERQEERDKAAREAQAAQEAKARAAIAGEVDKYKRLIGAKIRRKLVMPPDVPDDAVAEFVIMLLPDGSLVADPKLVKSSGNAAYDSAVERAIRAAEPLPLPKDEEARTQFINPTPLRLKFSPKDGNS